jgi:hypothetical protein
MENCVYLAVLCYKAAVYILALELVKSLLTTTVL